MAAKPHMFNADQIADFKTVFDEADEVRPCTSLAAQQLFRVHLRCPGMERNGVRLLDSQSAPLCRSLAPHIWIHPLL